MKQLTDNKKKKNRQALQRPPIRCFCQHNLKLFMYQLKTITNV